MPVAAANSIDFVTARAHGRFGRLAAPSCLENWARLGSLRELVRAVEGPSEVESCAAFERWLARDLARELVRLAHALEGSSADFVAWLAMATEVEDLKTRLRVGNAAPTDKAILPHLIHVSPPTEAETGARRAGAARVSEAERILCPAPRRHRPGQPDREEESSSPLQQELRLDRAYLVELLALARRLDANARETVMPLVRQEIDLFHLRVAFGVPSSETGSEGDGWRVALHIPGSEIGRREFVQIINESRLAHWVHEPPEGRPSPVDATHRDPLPSATDEGLGVRGGSMGRLRADTAPKWGGCGLRRVLGPSSEENATSAPAAAGPAVVELERRAWRRLGQLARRAFRRDPTGLGALAGYAFLRRMAAEDLGRMAEGIRLGLSVAERRARLSHSPNPEDGHA
ncbi:MAG: V-type ATPase subunit [Verrucomicrobiales bacterium]|nr:V-type ATPase subunit [Verrucomicrobiales bacterium]